MCVYVYTYLYMYLHTYMYTCGFLVRKIPEEGVASHSSILHAKFCGQRSLVGGLQSSVSQRSLIHLSNQRKTATYIHIDMPRDRQKDRETETDKDRLRQDYDSICTRLKQLGFWSYVWHFIYKILTHFPYLELNYQLSAQAIWFFPCQFLLT